MILIFDFDHTVFDMMSMHADMIATVGRLGISEKDYRDAYTQVTNWKMFTVDAMAQRLHRTIGADVGDVVAGLHEVAERSGKYMYADVKSAFEHLRKQGHKIYLLSWGDPDWQQKKISRSSALPLCEDVLSVTQIKADYLKSWPHAGSQVVLIDDRPAELKSVEDSGQPIKLIRMRREGGKYSDQETPQGMMEAKDMADIMQIVEKMGV